MDALPQSRRSPKKHLLALQQAIAGSWSCFLSQCRSSAEAPPFRPAAVWPTAQESLLQGFLDLEPAGHCFQGMLFLVVFPPWRTCGSRQRQ